jgi:hypothetical protein
MEADIVAAGDQPGWPDPGGHTDYQFIDVVERN